MFAIISGKERKENQKTWVEQGSLISRSRTQAFVWQSHTDAPFTQPDASPESSEFPPLLYPACTASLPGMPHSPSLSKSYTSFTTQLLSCHLGWEQLFPPHCLWPTIRHISLGCSAGTSVSLFLMSNSNRSVLSRTTVPAPTLPTHEELMLN